MRPLPDTDLARITVLSERLQRQQLQMMKAGRPPYSYAPLRKAATDLFNIQPGGFFSHLPPTPWEIIRDKIIRFSRSEQEQDANLAVATAMHSFVIKNQISGVSHDFPRLSLGKLDTVRFWEPAILAWEEKRFLFFIDARKSKYLTERARSFVFSLMHEHVRVSDPDFSKAEMMIINAPRGDGENRQLRVHKHEGEKLLNFDQLDNMIQFTYNLWIEIIEEREEDRRSRGTGTSGPLI